MCLETAEHINNFILTRRMLLEMITEFLAAISIKLHFEHFKSPQVLRCLDASLRVYSLPHSRQATLSILLSEMSSTSKNKLGNKLEIWNVPNFLIKRVE